jgi:hypothetical protein
MTEARRPFLPGFLLGALAFLIANLLAAHLRSDCGILAVIGRAACADDIRRAGFPLLFWEEGGFAYRHSFDGAALAFDAAVGLGLAVLAGLLAGRLRSRPRD